MTQKFKYQKRKTIDLYTFVYNDEDILPFFLNYYKFVDCMTFIDSGSTDRTLDLIWDYAARIKVEIRVVETGLTSWDHDRLHEYRNEIWKGSEMDYVFFPDCDEIFFHPDLKKFLLERRADVYEMEGYEMVSDKFPEGTDILKIKTGFPHQMYNKSTIFNPKIRISFPNAHLRYTPTTNVSIGDIKLLHYRYLGVNMIKKRRERERSRLPHDQKIRTFHSDERIARDHQQFMVKSKKVI